MDFQIDPMCGRSADRPERRARGRTRVVLRNTHM